MLEKNIFVKYRKIKNINYLVYNNEIFELNEVGMKIWILLENYKNTKEIYTQLAKDCGVTLETVSNDVIEYVDKLIESGLVKNVPN